MPVLKSKETPSQKVTDGLERKLIHLDNLMTVICEFTNGPMVQPDPPHSHPHEQITYIAEGEVYVFIDGIRTHLVKGDVFAVPGGIPHGIQTLTEYAKLIDTFTPIRQEFILAK
jgi:quercetin dioxygenase-like cupin family protein